MQINLSELFTCEGKEKDYTPDIEMTCFYGPDGTYEIREKKPVVLHVKHTGGRKLEATGKAALSLMIPCSRCLEPVKVDFDLDIDISLDLNQSEEDRVENLDEQPYISGNYLDVDQLVRNELLLNLPMKVLCDENCKGICNRCGRNLNHGDCQCERSSPDPRMSVIQDIFKQFKEV
ncbi:MAG: DUF177 domain-containing protein [Lachnoclostridium edouardi]|uniref:YceD family protein n=1 Tax=Lachnoclostridium edouardi TaxID=1926283 RepID=UPI0026DD0E85|nr:DUF177 domain-containing protein [Lachnoclostridium edouardi]MDO4278387.1 DUF177 domain-containing protein [Lachnoclostridium edouardi]